MKTSSFFKIAASLAFITFTGIFSGYIFAPATQEAHPPSSPLSPQLQNVKSATKGYVVKEKGGVLAIYSKLENNTLILFEEYDTPVLLLPEADRTALQKGIETKTLSDAIVMVENFSG